MTRSQLAINSVSTRHTSLPQMLDAYAQAGFRNVEFCLPHVKDYLDQGHQPSHVKRMLDERGMACIGGFESVVRAFGEPTMRRQANDLVAANAELLAELGAGTMVVGTDGPAEGEPVTDLLGQIAEAFAAVGDRIRGLEVTACIEFNWSPVVKSIRTAAEVARRSGAENVGIVFDPAHYHCTPSKFEQLVPETVAIIRHVHACDMRDKPGELSNCNSDRALPGEGHLDLRALFDHLERHGYGGVFSIEMFSPQLWNLPTEEAARRMRQSMLPFCSD